MAQCQSYLLWPFADDSQEGCTMVPNYGIRYDCDSVDVVRNDQPGPEPDRSLSQRRTLFFLNQTKACWS